jgi:hypothetical protein
VRVPPAPPIGACVPRAPFSRRPGWGACAPGPAYRCLCATSPGARTHRGAATGLFVPYAGYGRWLVRRIRLTRRIRATIDAQILHCDRILHDNRSTPPPSVASVALRDACDVQGIIRRSPSSPCRRRADGGTRGVLFSIGACGPPAPFPEAGPDRCGRLVRRWRTAGCSRRWPGPAGCPAARRSAPRRRRESGRAAARDWPGAASRCRRRPGSRRWR